MNQNFEALHYINNNKKNTVVLDSMIENKATENITIETCVSNK